MEPRKSFQQTVGEELDTHMQKKKRNRHKPYILHEILLKTDCKPKCRNVKLSDSQKIRENLDDLGFGNEFVDKKPKPQSMKDKKC